MPYNWWIWGADIQFSKYLDTSQVNYFEEVAQQMGPQDNLIICLAEPSWMLADFAGADEEENFFKISTIARKRGARIVAAIAGDWHNYNRYYAHDIDVHFITSGGGGAFLHPTHVLKNNISVRWPEPDEEAPAAGGEGAPVGEAWKARAYSLRLKRNSKAAAGLVEQAVQDVADVFLEPLQAPRGGRRRRRPLRPQAPKCYPSKTRSYLLSLGNIFFPFFNPAFAVGIGVIYWLITWQFQNLVGEYGISGGKIDALGVSSAFASVLPYMPLYLVQAMVASISLVAMLGALYATLIWYVDAIERPSLRRYVTKGVVGTLHFAAHLAVMFTLSLLVVMLNNRMAPPIERQLDALYRAREQQAPIVRDVIAETLEPLQQRREAAPAGGPPRPTPVRELVGFMSYPTLMVVLGAVFGGSLWGLYWVLTGIIGRMHSEQAFAALRIPHYKNFLRMKFERDKLTIYPLGIDRVPSAEAWISPPQGKPNPLPHNPRLIALRKIDVHLIEAPIVIAGNEPGA